MATALFESALSLDLIQRGKVRDLYAIDDEHMLIVTTDRISAFDVILPQAIPGKGEVLTQVANFWFERTKDLIPNHLSGIPVADVVQDKDELAQLGERGIVVKKSKPLPIEAIVRGYLIGSGWKDYQQTGAVCGIDLPAGLQMAQQLPEPIFTPSTKAEIGDHDENISYAQAVELMGEARAAEVRDISLKLYQQAAEYALTKGIIIADTKFEFGVDENDNLVLIDEVLTPDSSRFWPAEQHALGISPPSFDKQYMRDYLETLDWDKTDPGPDLPDNVIAETAAKYRAALELLTK